MSGITYTVNGDLVWQGWILCTDSGTSASGNNTWSSWTSGTDTSVTDSSNSSATQVWTIWAGSAGPLIQRLPEQGRAVSVKPVSEKERARLRAEREQREQEMIRRRKKWEKEQEEARLRAEALLSEFLNEEQQRQFESEKSFVVRGMSGKRYRLRYTLAGNIDELDKRGEVVARYCVHPTIDVPVADSLLTQKLWLESDEKALLTIANRTQVHRSPVRA